jgi:hypothetical protein
VQYQQKGSGATQQKGKGGKSYYTSDEGSFV